MMSFQLFALVTSALILISEGSSLNEKCSKSKGTDNFLDVAVDMIKKAKEYSSKCTNKAIDCEELFLSGFNQSGTYTIWPRSRLNDEKSLNVYCDMETDGGGWTVIQRRGDFKRPNDYFFKDWKNYKSGFGDIERDFWLGNDNIFALTNQKLYSVRFDLKDVEGTKKYALYDTFWIGDENQKYVLHVADYSGDAGDSMVAVHNGMNFSTHDADNDNHKTDNCAQVFKGGWWYNACHSSNLNGLYLKGKHKTYANGVHWDSFKGLYESLETTEIKLRSKNFRKKQMNASL